MREVRGWGLILGIELSVECGIAAASVVSQLMEVGCQANPGPGPRPHPDPNPNRSC